MAALLTQAEAHNLLAVSKESVLRDVLTWFANTRQEELFIELDGKERKFVLNLNRNPFEIRLHLRTKGSNFGLARIDNAAQHTNPDGNILRGPHLHWYREGFGLTWAEPIYWHDAAKPLDTLAKFLDLVHARFSAGFMEPLI